MEVQKRLGAKQMVIESLSGYLVGTPSHQVSLGVFLARLNLQLLMESDALVCTWTSNWFHASETLALGSLLQTPVLTLNTSRCHDGRVPPSPCQGSPVRRARDLRCRLVDELRMTAWNSWSEKMRSMSHLKWLWEGVRSTF